MPSGYSILTTGCVYCWLYLIFSEFWVITCIFKSVYLIIYFNLELIPFLGCFVCIGFQFSYLSIKQRSPDRNNRAATSYSAAIFTGIIIFSAVMLGIALIGIDV